MTIEFLILEFMIMNDMIGVMVGDLSLGTISRKGRFYIFNIVNSDDLNKKLSQESFPSTISADRLDACMQMVSNAFKGKEQYIYECLQDIYRYSRGNCKYLHPFSRVDLSSSVLDKLIGDNVKGTF